jgi:hypothetical protein
MARRGKPNITLRMDPELWEAFGTATPDRSGTLREFVRWYIREPGAKMPRRPDVTRTDHADHEISAPHSGA